MEDFNIKEIDFSDLDIDKYLDWLLEKYELFSEIQYLPYIQEEINSLHIRRYLLNSHYVITRSQSLPENIYNAFSKRIQKLEAQKAKFNGVNINELYFFDSVPKPQNTAKKEYGLFSAELIKNIYIDESHLCFWLKNDYGNSFIDEINERFEVVALPKLDYYKQELKYLLEEFEFEYLPQIINGQFIYNLNDASKALRFATEIDKIKVAVYLDCKIKGHTPSHPPTKPLRWAGNINTLATIFDELLKAGLIDGSKENIKRVLTANFVDDQNKPLSKDYLDEIFKPSKMKTDKKLTAAIYPFINYLSSLETK